MKLAARGARDLDHGVEPVTDVTEARLLRMQAARIHLTGVVVATLLTGLALIATARGVA